MWLVLILLGSALSMQHVRHVDRTNNGVYFEGVAEVDQPTGSWIHSFGIQTPRMSKNFGAECRELILNLCQLNNGTELTWMDKCIIELVGNRYETWKIYAMINPMNATELRMCQRHSHTLNISINMVWRSCEEIRNMESAVMSLLPKAITSEKVIKRGLINVVGNAAHYLFGIATAETTDNLENHVKALQNVLTTNQHLVMTVVASMQTLSKTG